MRILMFMGGVQEGGLEKHFVELANGLASHCQVVAVAHPRYRARFSPAVTWQPLDLSRSRHNPFMRLRLIRLIRQYRPDIVHAQGGKAAQILASLIGIGNALRIATVHGLKRKARYYRHLDHCICVSQGAAAPLELERFTTIYNGIAASPPTPCPPSPPQVLAVGRLVPEKGFDQLLEAWQHVAAPLQIAGEGPEQEALARQIAALNLQGRVTLLGHREDVEALMARHHLVVISSRREGFSYVFAESLLAERAVLVTDVPVANELLPPEMLIPRERPDALANAINQALADLEGCYRRYRPWFRFAREHFTREAMVERTLALYTRLLASR